MTYVFKELCEAEGNAGGEDKIDGSYANQVTKGR